MTTVIVEIGSDGIDAVYADDSNIRVVFVDHSWGSETVITCPYPSPACLARCDSVTRKAVERVIANPNQPQTIE